MKKRGLLHWIGLLPVAIILLSGCEKQGDKSPVDGVLPAMVGPEGGMVYGFEGEVVLLIPPGALKESVRFAINDLNYKSTQTGEDLLKAFVIEPFVSFDVPAKLSVYTCGCLSNGRSVCDEMDVFFLIWDNLSDYCNQYGRCCTTCCYEVTSHFISACVEKTGVIQTVEKAGGKLQ